MKSFKVYAFVVQFTVLKTIANCWPFCQDCAYKDSEIGFIDIRALPASYMYKKISSKFLKEISLNSVFFFYNFPAKCYYLYSR